MNKCDLCVVTDKEICKKCIDNPIYKDYPRWSYYQEYIPTCPRGYSDCVCDPAYIKFHYPNWYKELYGDLTPEEASKEDCLPQVKEDPDEKYLCYDNEDK